KKHSKEEENKETIKWLNTMFIGLLVVWIAYVLNLFDDLVPYVLGPVLYSIVAYSLSLIVIRKGYLQKISQSKYKTTPISEEQSEVLFKKVSQLIIEEKRYKNTDITLKSLSGQLNVSTQILSLVINQKSKMNFNSFINHHRIEEAIKVMRDEKHNNLTIAAIAFEIGFNSLSSFNSAFKKQIGKTPKNYREALTK
ncbi:MAG: AraC family transcriptional regulator, partial [Bacteroidota bacterium]